MSAHEPSLSQIQLQCQPLSQSQAIIEFKIYTRIHGNWQLKNVPHMRGEILLNAALSLLHRDWRRFTTPGRSSVEFFEAEPNFQERLKFQKITSIEARARIPALLGVERVATAQRNPLGCIGHWGAVTAALQFDASIELHPSSASIPQWYRNNTVRAREVCSEVLRVVSLSPL